MSSSTPAFVEIADRVFVLRYPVFDVNVTLVVGDEAAVLVDTLSTAAQAAEVAVAARRVTGAQWAIVNTHHHFDHAFGNATLARQEPPPAESFPAFGDPGADAAARTRIWAHEEAARLLGHEETARRTAWEAVRAGSQPELADEVARVVVLPPNEIVLTEAALDLGGRIVVLSHFGRGHTAGDLVAHVPDADVVIAGDLVEESGPPDFGDAYPLEWPGTVAALLRLTTPETVVVPGHGAPVGQGFVTGQHEELTELEWLIRNGHAERARVDDLARRAPFGAAAHVAIKRAYALLDGE
ncbi:MBL fold metallo-hydrolase [Asanoa ishikariensis]|uniref:Glyoxylase, beta-lactamase superfamily II n=1 Tax=Asanoa ishikariensis TaxID=137265 RepID=A0A1H3U0K5_9ACTN|nr:MBL fold metallo-hydrolase [Asanoa ishikariensis]GIF67753.1 MBL fold metallo-hydrolase [Asanoa ishikariensis]SDZ55591.1 Glyoxylase, beta-lactamase superfamily II [Asanoa ishikariensis]